MVNYYMVATVRESMNSIIGYILVNLESYKVGKLSVAELVKLYNNNEINIKNMRYTVRGFECTQGDINKYSIFNKYDSLMGFNVPVLIDKKQRSYIVSDCFGHLKELNKDKLNELVKNVGLANKEYVIEDSYRIRTKSTSTKKGGKYKEFRIGCIHMFMNEYKIKKLSLNDWTINNKDVEQCIILSKRIGTGLFAYRQCVMVANENVMTICLRGNKSLVKITDFKVMYINKKYLIRTVNDVNTKGEILYTPDNNMGMEIIYVVLGDKNILHIGIIADDDFEAIDLDLEVNKYTTLESLNFTEHFSKQDISILRDVEKVLGLVSVDKIKTKFDEANIENINYKEMQLTNRDKTKVYKSNIMTLNLGVNDEDSTYIINQNMKRDNKTGIVYKNVAAIKNTENSLEWCILKRVLLVRNESITIKCNDKNNTIKINSNNKLYNISYLGLNAYAKENNMTVDAAYRFELGDNVFKTKLDGETYIVYMNEYKFEFDLKKLKKLVEKYTNTPSVKLERKLALTSNDKIDANGLRVLANTYYTELELNRGCKGFNLIDCEDKKVSAKDTNNIEDIRKKVGIINDNSLSRLLRNIVYVKRLKIKARFKIKAETYDKLVCDEAYIDKDSLKELELCNFSNFSIYNLYIDCNIEDISNKLLDKLIANINIEHLHFNNVVTWQNLKNRLKIIGHDAMVNKVEQFLELTDRIEELQYRISDIIFKAQSRILMAQYWEGDLCEWVNFYDIDGRVGLQSKIYKLREMVDNNSDFVRRANHVEKIQTIINIMNETIANKSVIITNASTCTGELNEDNDKVSVILTKDYIELKNWKCSNKTSDIKFELNDNSVYELTVKVDSMDVRIREDNIDISKLKEQRRI